MNRKVFSAVIALFMSFIMYSGAAASSADITISAAISLKNAFEELGRLFETGHKNMKVSFNFGLSGDLIRQIEAGAPVDVFASADLKDMDELERKGLIVPGSRAYFAANAVVLVIPVNAKARIKIFEDLKSGAAKKIAVGNPKTVPAGRYAEEVFRHHKIFSDIKDKLVFTENVRQALDYVARGEVDAGVVYSTDAMARAKEVRIAAVAAETSHKSVVYPVAVIKGTKNEKTAKDFTALVTSREGRKILEKYGFKAVR